ncbi:unnamed protein product [Pedinophyceae sp. YPF-701]|nr:unnamed protein product [Pedinophyceae sp. YPF-701]
MSLFVVFVGANVAFLMVVVEFRVIQETSALTLMVAGSFKEIVTVLAAVLLFHDTFTAVNGMGLFILLVGVSLFNLHKYYRFRQHGKGGGPGGHADAAGRPEEHRRTGGAEQEMHAMHAAQAAGARTNGGGGQEPTWRTSAD